MQYVYDAITEATGVTDAATLDAIFDYMEMELRTFNGATRDRLHKEARLGKACVDYENSPAGRAEIAALDAQYA